MNNLSALTTTELSEMISNGDITSEELVRATLNSIKLNDPKINSFITINEENSIQKAKEIDIELEDEALTLLAERTEGNLFATSQELTKLSLLFDGESISLKKMEKSISNSSRYGIFDLSHAFVEGDKTRMVKIIEILKAEGTQPPLVLWALSKEVNNLYKVLEAGNANDIWGPRYYLDALSKRAREISLSKIKKSLKEIAEIDSSIKGLSTKSPWQSIRDLVLDL